MSVKRYLDQRYMNKQEEIRQLKQEKDAVLLAHYYVDEEVQKIADYVGDSFYLSKIASSLNNRTLGILQVYPLWEKAENC